MAYHDTAINARILVGTDTAATPAEGILSSSTAAVVVAAAAAVDGEAEAATLEGVEAGASPRTAETSS